MREPRTPYILQSRQLLSFGCLPHHDGAIEEIRVVGMDRLTRLQHHVVGDVDCQRDRSHTRQLDAAGEPAWTRPTRMNPGDCERNEEWTRLRLQLNRITHPRFGCH